MEPLNLRSKLRQTLAALVFFGIVGTALLPSLHIYAVQMCRRPEWPPYAGALPLAAVVLLWRLWQSEPAGKHRFRPVAILLFALGFLCLGLACSAPWLTWLAAAFAAASALDHVGGTDLIVSTWHLLLVLALGALLPFWFFQPISDKFQLLLLPAGQSLLESCGIVCVIDGDVIELYPGRLDPAQTYFGMSSWAGVLAGCLIWANLRGRGPIHAAVLSVAALVWLWLVSAGQILVLGMILENQLPLAGERATLIPITIAAGVVLSVLIVSTDEPLARFGNLLVQIGARLNTAAEPETVMTEPPAVCVAKSARWSLAAFTWRGLLVGALAVGLEQFLYDGQYWTPSTDARTSVDLMDVRQSLFPRNWQNWHLISFARHRDVSCLGKAKAVATWQYESSDKKALVTISRRMQHGGATAAGDSQPSDTSSSADSATDIQEIEEDRDRTGSKALVFSSELVPTLAAAHEQPHDYFQAWSREGLGELASQLRAVCSSASLCLSVSFEGYADFGPNQKDRARQFASAIVRQAQSTDWAAEAGP